jgi:membrane-associated phospholipid phosphatase
LKNENNYTTVNFAIISLQFSFILMFLAFFGRIQNPAATGYKLLAVLIFTSLTLFTISVIKKDNLKAVLQTGFVFVFFGFFYELSSQFQFIIHQDWQDDKLILLDKFFFGGELSLLMQGIVTPYLTEAMMLSYIMYFPLLPLVAIAAYRKGSSKGLGEYLLMLSMAYAFCYYGFILFPAAGQLYSSPGQYAVPLEGGFFTYLGEVVRSKAHFPGGNLPSPHCAAATVMLFILFKYHRNLFLILLPFILLLYVSTVYCRYHYSWDAATGILLSLVIITLVPRLKEITIKACRLFTGLAHSKSVPE